MNEMGPNLIMERPPCIKCGAGAITVVNRQWLCGDCLIKFQEKLNKLKDSIMFEE